MVITYVNKRKHDEINGVSTLALPDDLFRMPAHPREPLSESLPDINSGRPFAKFNATEDRRKGLAERFTGNAFSVIMFTLICELI